MSSESDYKDASIKVIPFSGKSDTFLVWDEKNKAKAMINGRLGLLMGTEKMPSKSDYEAAIAKEDAGTTLSAAEKKTISSYERGLKLYSEFILSMNTTKAGGKVAFEINSLFANNESCLQFFLYNYSFSYSSS